MFRKPKFSPHHHTGRYLPHHHTSYSGLVFVVVLVGVLMAMVGSGTQAATPYTGPDSGAIGLSGKVPGPPPSKPAVITSPKSGQHFTTVPITVSGTCPANTLIEIFKNDIFAGSTGCHNEAFKVDIDLLYGANTLVARVYDDLGQQGPDSNSVTVFYDASPPTVPANAPVSAGRQVLLRSDAVYRGAFPGDNLKINIEVLGGLAPYAISIDWGDGRNDLKSLAGAGQFDIGHVYDKPGSYTIMVHARDGLGGSAYLQVVAIVNGKPEAAGLSSPLGGSLGLAWPILIAVFLIVLSFWLGEKYREQRLKQSPALTGALPGGF